MLLVYLNFSTLHQHLESVFTFYFFVESMTPVGLMEALDGRPLPVSSVVPVKDIVSSMCVIFGHSAVFSKKSGQLIAGLKLGTLSWSTLATRPPSPSTCVNVSFNN